MLMPDAAAFSPSFALRFLSSPYAIIFAAIAIDIAAFDIGSHCRH